MEAQEPERCLRGHRFAVLRHPSDWSRFGVIPGQSKISLETSPILERMINNMTYVDGLSGRSCGFRNKIRFSAFCTEPKSSPALKFVAPLPNKA